MITAALEAYPFYIRDRKSINGLSIIRHGNQLTRISQA